MKICENCKKEHEGTYGSGRFCSTECARGFSTKGKRSLINERVSKKMKKPDRVKICPICHDEFIGRKKQICCSPKCRNKKWTNTEKQRKIFSDRMKQRHIDGDTSIGWQSRDKMKMSNPEKIVNKILLTNKLIFEREYRMGKWFIDFAFIKEKIALEIDGKQHSYINRKQKDKEKDNYLQQNGWKVIRIGWVKDNSEEVLKFIKLFQAPLAQ
jgi:very-short-patch-repair endonuclease